MTPPAKARLLRRNCELPPIPSVAVIRENDRDHVYVQTGERTFRFTPVDVGTVDSQGQRPVLKGLDAGMPVVVEGAFHLHNERKRAELQ